MRVRILRSSRGEVDGIPLDRFVTGRVYDVPASLATFMLVERLAAPENDTRPALVVPLEETEPGEHKPR